jgi:hypothetical protein
MNRLDKVVVFHPLKREELDEVLELELGPLLVSDNERRTTVPAARGNRSAVWSTTLEARHRAVSGRPALQAAGHRTSPPGRCAAHRPESRRGKVDIPEGRGTAASLFTDAICVDEFKMPHDRGSSRLSECQLPVREAFSNPCKHVWSTPFHMFGGDGHEFS